MAQGRSLTTGPMDYNELYPAEVVGVISSEQLEIRRVLILWNGENKGLCTQMRIAKVLFLCSIKCLDDGFAHMWITDRSEIESI